MWRRPLAYCTASAYADLPIKLFQAWTTLQPQRQSIWVNLLAFLPDPQRRQYPDLLHHQNCTVFFSIGGIDKSNFMALASYLLRMAASIAAQDRAKLSCGTLSLTARRGSLSTCELLRRRPWLLHRRSLPPLPVPTGPLPCPV